MGSQNQNLQDRDCNQYQWEGHGNQKGYGNQNRKEGSRNQNREDGAVVGVVDQVDVPVRHLNRDRNVGREEFQRSSGMNRNVRARIENRAPPNPTSEDSERISLQGFLDTTGSNICSSAHATALIGILQVAKGNENGVLASLGHNNRSRWVNQNLNAFFAPGGPLDSF